MTARSLHIAVVSPEFPPDIGGVETYAFEYARELVRRGHRVTVFTQPHRAGEIELEGVRIQPALRLNRTVDLAAIAASGADLWHPMNAAYAWLALHKANTVVSVHGNDFLKPYLPISGCDLGRIPLAWRIAPRIDRALRPAWSKYTARLIRAALPRARRILANSRYTEQVLLQRFPRCGGKTSVAYVGVREDFFGVAHTPAADGVPRLLTVCRLSEPRKNVDLILRALAQLQTRYAFRYTVVGDGPERPRLEALAHELGLEGRVRFAGFVSQEELFGYYGKADLFVLASSVIPGSHEGFGIVYLEAAASGVPALAARLAGAAEAVREGVSGMFVQQPSVEALAGALEQFLTGERSFDREACRRFAREFSWARVVDHGLADYAGRA